ncbi:MAG: imidazolonepropionase-like amidohydrolase/Tol biopolymer transport system component [Saprospiraceae bacterium]|jgi:imidazolonepropionase-like amidohydrolase/Tol biopolymer transport system component
MIHIRFSILIALTIATFSLSAQDNPKWDVNNPPGESKTITINTTEGTWMNVDISPDGKTLAFDMLGDIFTMAATGGKATPIRTGLAWEVQPRWSPDGKQILFTSDAGGGDNLWTMNGGGADTKQLTKEKFRLLNNGEWIPGTDFVIARKHFSSTRSLGAGELWMYHTSGGEGIQIVKKKNDQQDINEPSVSSDGRYIYYSEDAYPGGYFQYNKDPNDQIYMIKQYDRETGKTKRITGGPGGACRPQISHDGKTLAYVRRIRTKSVLYIHEMETGRDFPLFDGLSKDQQEAWAIFGAYTGFDWAPDDKSIYVWGQGKIHNVDVATKKATNIPFEVSVKHKLMETVEFDNPVDADKFEVKVIRGAVTSPDEKTLVFNALGHLYKMSLPNGTPKRMTTAVHFEFEPAFSPDGKWITYVTWDDELMGTIKKMNLNGNSGQDVVIEKGIYRTPTFSIDGQKIAYRKEGGNGHMGYSYNVAPGIYEVAVNGGKSTLLTTKGEYPQYSADGKKLFVTNGGYVFGNIKKSFEAYDFEKKTTETIFNTKYTTQFTPSPDNKWVAFTELYKVYIAPMPMTGQPFGLSAKTKAVPVAQVAKDAGINLHWSSNSKKLHWTLGNEYFTEELTDRFLFLEGAVDSIPPIDTVGLKINLMSDMDKPTGKIALRNAKIITMEGDQIIENGTVLIDGNKIAYVGDGKGLKLDSNTKIIDLEGKTIMPGIIDVHAHLGAFRGGISPQKHWQYYTNLAYGVTTTHDPSVNTEITFAQSEMVKSGKMVGPRIFSTGTILYGADGDFKAVINNLEDAKSALRRTKAYGAFSVKSYNQPRRNQRQQIIEAARQLGIRVVPEGGSFFYHNMSMVADGHTSVEHNIPVAPLYKDVIDFWAASNTSNTPTLIVNYGGLNGEYYWYQNTNVWEKERLLTFTPRPIIDSRSRHRTMAPQEDYDNGHILTSQSCKKLQDAGVNINLGAHGQIQGLGAHWELWMLGQGGMTNMQALRSATINGAEYLGMDKEIGSIKEGKLADIIVIDGDPSKNLSDSENVVYTIINGRLYNAATMNEVGNNPAKRSKFYWEMEGSGNAYPFFIETNSFMEAQCACRH